MGYLESPNRPRPRRRPRPRVRLVIEAVCEGWKEDERRRQAAEFCLLIQPTNGRGRGRLARPTSQRSWGSNPRNHPTLNTYRADRASGVSSKNRESNRQLFLVARDAENGLLRRGQRADNRHDRTAQRFATSLAGCSRRRSRR
jgi:hypothetical protein